MSLKLDNKNLKQMANAIRILSAEAVERANSGHPGMPMVADCSNNFIYTIYKHRSHNPNWPDRDRFVLSAGHGSMYICN